MRVAVVTAVFTRNNIPVDDVGCFQKDHPEWDYILFTDSTELKAEGPWEVRVIEPPFGYRLYATKHVKWLTHLYLPDYDFIVWVDSYYRPSSPDLLDPVFHSLTTYNRPIAMRTQNKANVMQDMSWCLTNGCIDAAYVSRVTDRLKGLGHDPNQDSQTFWSSGMVKANKNPLLWAMADDLFRCLVEVGYRDQHWLPYVFSKYRINCQILPNGMFTRVGSRIHGNHHYACEPRPAVEERNVFINNVWTCHFEIIESIFTIFIPKILPHAIYRVYIRLKRPGNEDFQTYITEKYDHCSFVEEKPTDITFDAEIEATFYERMLPVQPDVYYIAHEVTDKLLAHDKIYFLTPLCGAPARWFLPTILPAVTRIRSHRIVLLIQGNLTPKRRNYRSLIPMLETVHEISIKIMGWGGNLPACLLPYADRIDFKPNLPFRAYHEQLADVDYILPLIDDSFEHSYFRNKLTSSISYGRAYGLGFICHPRLKEIYDLPDPCYTYTDPQGLAWAASQAVEQR